MQSADLDSARKDILQWSTPIVADFLGDQYVALLGPKNVSAKVLASIHTRLWRLVLLDDASRLAAVRKELRDLARIAGVDAATLDALDQAVLEELLDVITVRFQRSTEFVRIYSRLLLKAAGNLAEMRVVAA